MVAETLPRAGNGRSRGPRIPARSPAPKAVLTFRSNLAEVAVAVVLRRQTEVGELVGEAERGVDAADLLQVGEVGGQVTEAAEASPSARPSSAARSSWSSRPTSSMPRGSGSVGSISMRR